MEHDESASNVYALFPGVETTPFGRAAALDELSDEGWSATPERTLVVDDHADDGRQAAGRQYSARTAAVASVLIAVLAGAGLAAGRALLTPASRHGLQLTASQLAASELAAASAASHRELAWVPANRHPEFVLRRSRQRSVAHHETNHHVARGAKKSRPVGASSSGLTGSGPSEQPTTVPVVASTASYSGGAGGGTGGSGGSSSQSAQPAGPSGRVALIGAGTTPSG